MLGGTYDLLEQQLAPGVTNTPGAARNTNVEGLRAKVSSGPNANFFRRLTEPEEVAATVAFLCSPGARQISGQTIHVSAGTITP